MTSAGGIPPGIIQGQTLVLVGIASNPWMAFRIQPSASQHPPESESAHVNTAAPLSQENTDCLTQPQHSCSICTFVFTAHELTGFLEINIITPFDNK